jgi:hypothetical protein
VPASPKTAPMKSPQGATIWRFGSPMFRSASSGLNSATPRCAKRAATSPAIHCLSNHPTATRRQVVGHSRRGPCGLEIAGSNHRS